MIAGIRVDEPVVVDLLDALRVEEGTDLVREVAQWATQQLAAVPPTIPTRG